MSKDIIRWVIDRMLAHDDSITQELALTVEREARAEWGGQRIDYIAKTCPEDLERRRALQGRTDPERERAAVAAYLADEPVPAIEQRFGISRRTLYRMIKR
jgi:transposase-like protein